MIWPIKGLKDYKVYVISDQPIYISQGFGGNPQIYGQFGLLGHNGIDIAAPLGTPIYAAHDGRIKYFTEPSGYGKYAEIIGINCKTVYGHQQKFEGANRLVKQGEVIGYVNSTGFSTGHHLHFGYKPIPTNYSNGYKGSVDPMPFMETHMNQTKPYLAKDGKTILLVTPVAMDFENFKKQAGVEGIIVPEVIPPASSL